MGPGVALRLCGAHVLRPEGLVTGDLAIASGQIAADADGRDVDLSGLMLFPGIVDAHGDGFERHMAPRRGAVNDPGEGLRALEAELLANGITTACLAQFWSWEGGMRGPVFARRLAEALRGYDGTLDLRFLLRLELGCWQDIADVEAFVAEHGIGHLVLSDHLPHRALEAGRRVPRLEGQALKAGRSPAAHQDLLEALHAEMPEARAALPGFLAGLAARGVRLGSHDDETPQDRAAFRAIGCALAEFPTTLETANAASDAGDAVVMGAPNVLRGGSHNKGSVSAREVLEAGACGALASDYHYPAPLGAARRLWEDGWDLARAWALVSSGPAEVLGLNDRGVIAVGKRADLVILSHDLSRVHGVICAGHLAFADAVLAERLLT